MAVGTRLSPNGPYIVIDPVRLAAFMRSPNGPVMAALMRGATAVQAGARAQVGKRTRQLEGSIVKRPGVDREGPFVLVVTEGVPYAYMHHEGTDPHVIRPRTRKALRWLGRGGVLFAAKVNHPGTQANRYLADNAHLAGR